MRIIIDIHPPRAIEPGLPVRRIQALDAHAATGLGRVDEASVAEVHADVREGLVARVVEDEIAGSEVPALHGPAGPALRLSVMREVQPRSLLEGVGDETAAIEASLGRAAAIG